MSAHGRLRHFPATLHACGVFIETGLHKHAIQQTFFLYVCEPGGNRVEVAQSGARLILAPDWKPIVWTEEERKTGQAWGLRTIEPFHTHGIPPVGGRLERFRAKHALGLDPGVDTGSRKENASK
jgi:hypothetical protein